MSRHSLVRKGSCREGPSTQEDIPQEYTYGIMVQEMESCKNYLCGFGDSILQDKY